MADFERDHPDISLRLSASYQLVDFAVSTDVDAAIRYGRGHWPGVEAELIIDDVIFPVCSPEVAKRLKEPSDLLTQRLFVEDPYWDFWEYWTRAAGLDANAESTHRFSDDFHVQMQAAALGHGITLARGLLVADELRAGRLVCPFKVAVRAPVQYYYVYPTERRADKLIETMAAWLKRTAQASVAGMTAHWGEPVVPADATLRAL
jgi:DNA-binding transcriptional LysR family regulator